MNNSTEPTAAASTTPETRMTGSSAVTPETQKAGISASTPEESLFLLKSRLHEGEHKPLKEHLESCQVPQSVLDSCLLEGMQILQMKNHGIPHVTQSLILFLQFGAKWKSKKVLEKLMTPYHVICQSTGDQNELLDLMMSSSGRTLLNVRDSRGCTAMMYAAQNANIKCVRSLITNGANANLCINKRFSDMLSPLIAVIKRLHPTSQYSAVLMTEIFDLLLESGVDVNKPCSFNRTPIMYASSVGSIDCVRKLIQKDARLYLTDCEGKSVWAYAALSGSVEVLKCLFDHGIDKDSTDKQGRSVLFWAVKSRNVEAMRYLLNQGVTMGTYTPGQYERQYERPYKHGVVNRLFLDNDMLPFQQAVDPCMLAIDMNMPHVARLMEEYGCQKFKTFDAVRKAVTSSSVEVLDYLLCKHKYPLNHEYTVQYPFGNTPYQTLLTESCYVPIAQVPKLLLEHGADPNKKNCVEKGSTAIHIAIIYGSPNVEMIAHIIRSGADVNVSSYDQAYGNLLPFEASILHHNIHAAEMLLASGCSCGVYSLGNNHRFKDYIINSEFEELMKTWNVLDNNAKTLQQCCRTAIVNHLSPAAEKKLSKLPLPKNIIMYLNVPELDDIIDESTRHLGQGVESSLSEHSGLTDSSDDDSDSNSNSDSNLSILFDT